MVRGALPHSWRFWLINERRSFLKFWSPWGWAVIISWFVSPGSISTKSGRMLKVSDLNCFQQMRLTLIGIYLNNINTFIVQINCCVKIIPWIEIHSGWWVDEFYFSYEFLRFFDHYLIIDGFPRCTNDPNWCSDWYSVGNEYLQAQSDWLVYKTVSSSSEHEWPREWGKWWFSSSCTYLWAISWCHSFSEVARRERCKISKWNHKRWLQVGKNVLDNIRALNKHNLFQGCQSIFIPSQNNLIVLETHRASIRRSRGWIINIFRSRVLKCVHSWCWVRSWQSRIKG